MQFSWTILHVEGGNKGIHRPHGPVTHDLFLLRAGRVLDEIIQAIPPSIALPPHHISVLDFTPSSSAIAGGRLSLRSAFFKARFILETVLSVANISNKSPLSPNPEYASQQAPS